MAWVTEAPVTYAHEHADADLSDAALAASITTLAANIAAATYQWLRLIAEFDRRQAWAGVGIHSCAHWLNWRCGLDLGAAREKVRVARALETLPAIAASFASGRITYSKVRAMTRVATPANQAALLNIAHHGTAAHVERAVRAYRRVLRIQDTLRARQAHAHRELRWHFDDDGSLVLKARLPAEIGALVVKALTAAGEELRAAGEPADVSAETSAVYDAHAARRADALAHLAEQYLAHEPVALKQADRHQIVIHVERECLHEHGEGGRCELEDGPVLAAETARRLACDAAMVELEEDADGTPLDIGRKTRTVPPALRRALQSRDRGCRFPGCTHTRYVDAHHIHHWADGGETSLDNLLLLCRRHHRALHEGRFTLVRRDDQRLLFLTPQGELLPEVPVPLLASEPVEHLVRRAGVDVSAATCVPNWYAGDRMDLGMAVQGFFQADGRLEYPARDMRAGCSASKVVPAEALE